MLPRKGSEKLVEREVEKEGGDFMSTLGTPTLSMKKQNEIKEEKK